MEIHLKICGVMMIVLACVHLIFPAYFNWKKEFESISLINKQMMHVHTFFVALMVLLMGLLCVCCAGEMCTSALGKKISLGLFIFWVCRLFTQFFWYSPKLWLGKTLETIVHIFFSFLWVYFCAVFFMVWRG